MPAERSAQLITIVLPVLYLDKRGRLKVRIHGRPRSDRKRSFLLSAVAPSTSTRHPREARPINWAQRGGLASGGKFSPDAEATFHRASCTLGNQVVAASDGSPFRQERRPTRFMPNSRGRQRSAYRSKHSASWVIVSWVAIASLSTVESSALRSSIGFDLAVFAGFAVDAGAHERLATAKVAQLM
jgi:hypothetical protein